MTLPTLKELLEDSVYSLGGLLANSIHSGGKMRMGEGTWEAWGGSGRKARGEKVGRRGEGNKESTIL